MLSHGYTVPLTVCPRTLRRFHGFMITFTWTYVATGTTAAAHVVPSFAADFFTCLLLHSSFSAWCCVALPLLRWVDRLPAVCVASLLSPQFLGALLAWFTRAQVLPLPDLRHFSSSLPLRSTARFLYATLGFTTTCLYL